MGSAAGGVASKGSRDSREESFFSGKKTRGALQMWNET